MMGFVIVWKFECIQEQAEMNKKNKVTKAKHRLGDFRRPSFHPFAA